MSEADRGAIEKAVSEKHGDLAVKIFRTVLEHLDDVAALRPDWGDGGQRAPTQGSIS